MDDLKVTYKDPRALTPRARNPRTHSRTQVRQIADSIRAFGFANPILLDETGSIVAGHGRVEAAKQLGLERVPTITLDDLTPAQIRAYVIADNKLAENAGWDSELLALELADLSVELNFDLTMTGFEPPEIDVLIESLDEESEVDDHSDAIVRDTGTPITQSGDLWEVGTHRLICAEALDGTAYERLLGGSLHE